MFESVYDNYSVIYSELESLLGIIYDDIKKDSTNIEKANLFQNLGNIALKVIYSQMQLVEDYGDPHYKDQMLSNLDNKSTMLFETLKEDRNRLR